ncbi:hypothetical protein [Chromohalobacter israelensis]|uniref:hypothetical protein n=1 Tax=Chromohalobacter israelensis TaxID=141390 RepID=UPI00265BBE2F|nr:hypothetical protein [Chromohalobacter salexigens]MDO0946634.1 hypothetical protein [Chromohalobacter salexigens]
MGGGSSSSSSDKTYNTTNVSQQSEGANVYGRGNQVVVQRADAVTLDNIAKSLEAGTRSQADAGAKMVEGGYDLASDISDTSRDINRDSLDFAEGVNVDSLDFAEGVNRDSLGLAGDALSGMEKLARQVAQAGEEGSQRAMDFVSNYTEREQVGNSAEATKTVIYVAGFAAIALVGIAWASKGKIKA